MAALMHSFSTARSSAGAMPPDAAALRASCRARGRSRLPTWSARKGGRVRAFSAASVVVDIAEPPLDAAMLAVHGRGATAGLPTGRLSASVAWDGQHRHD